MATQANNVTAIEPKTSTERFEIAFGLETKTEQVGKDGKKVTVAVLKDGKPVRDAVTLSVEKATELEKDGFFEGQVINVSCEYPASWEGLIELGNKEYKDEEGKPRSINEVRTELVKLFRNGATSKVMNRMRAQLTSVDKETGNLTFKDEDAPNGVLDLTSEITSGSKRIFLTEEQKTWKNLSNLPTETRKTVWAAYLTAIGKEHYLPAE